MHTFTKSILFIVMAVLVFTNITAATPPDLLLNSSIIKGGLIIHAGCGDGVLTASLSENGKYLVHGLDSNSKNVEEARKYIMSKGLYGRVSVDKFDGHHLPYIDNLVNLVVISKTSTSLSNDEIERVLAPGGVLLTKGQPLPTCRLIFDNQSSRVPAGWNMFQKLIPDEIDEWPQYLHGADNNAVAHDTVVGPPRHLQWVTYPEWSRSHMGIPTVVSIVSSGGRLFSIEDRATVENPFLPGKFALIARDAFNGLLLWKYNFKDWEPVTRYIKDITVQLQRRLVATKNIVYCTPGLNASVTALDAATGKIIKTYRGTEHTQEFAYDRGVLYLVTGDRMNAARYNIVKKIPSKGISLGGSDPKAPFDGTGFRGSYAPETQDRLDPVCAIVVIDANSGKRLWFKKNIHRYVGCTLAIKEKYTVYQTLDGIFCLNSKTGDRIWNIDKKILSGDGTEPNTLILSKNSVYTKDGNSLYAYSLENGSLKWQGPIADNYEKSADIFLAAGAVWTGGSKRPASYDPETGLRLKIIKQLMNGPMSHDRCYRNFITDLYYINSKTGGADFLELDSSKEFPNYWTRGTCGMGVLPCNGLLYTTPFSCQCSIGVMIRNTNALYTEKYLKSSDQDISVKRNIQLVKGPAFDKTIEKNIVKDSVAGASSWPTYRHDGKRSGATMSKVSAKLKTCWEARLKTIPSAPVIAEDKVFVSDINAHTLYALDVSNGAVAWNYVAGGRVDSPPTYYRGFVLFGSRDGWVHCLRASDGALAWRFRDLPDRRIVAFERLESTWPVSGSILIKNNVAYFAAGRNSFLDGGIFLYGLNPLTGKIIFSRRIYGPFDKKNGFPATKNKGFKAGILVSGKDQLYIRHKAFNLDLTDSNSPSPHLIPTAGFLDATPQHRTYWTISTRYFNKAGIRASQWNRPSGDILATYKNTFYEVRGFPVKRHSYFDPRVKGYKLYSGILSTPKKKWSKNIPITGDAIMVAGDILFVAGRPAYFPPNHPVAKYEEGYAGKLGAVLWAASTKDGRKLAEYKLDAAPAWDSMAAANGKLIVTLKNGAVLCMEQDHIKDSM